MIIESFLLLDNNKVRINKKHVRTFKKDVNTDELYIKLFGSIVYKKDLVNFNF